ncbi:response regulator transcription factor [Halarcobacter ebronensis]|uniref:DNA-binding response regulator n=1 Tax=Halarcobacter ebronensis TaxID=1462615 RepID=A0A4Q1AN51_9BACT|nr:response regulator transcription factor [Halarcobacter ebronensis]QKF82435.1 two-component system response regulator [Halarcobacter ebronensis]RXK07544.1 DNA-binding response regulator [Halarcobacter ebronensis]
MNILLLEDDFDYKNSIKEYLQTLGYAIDDFENGNDAYDAIYEKNYHLLILDIRVPGLSGYEIVKNLRAENNNIPVIFITSLTDINNLSMGYELGCNDYIKKPFSPKELKYRIEQVIKSFYFTLSENRIKLNDDFFYDTSSRQLYKNEEIMNLTKKEQEIIFLLISNKNCFVSIEQLRCDIWNEKYMNEADIRVFIKNIRDKTSKELIETKRGLGYKIARTN